MIRLTHIIHVRSQWGQYSWSRWMTLIGMIWRLSWGKHSRHHGLSWCGRGRAGFVLTYTYMQWTNGKVDKGFLVYILSGQILYIVKNSCNCWLVVQDPSWAWITTAWSHRNVPAVSLHVPILVVQFQPTSSFSLRTACFSCSYSLLAKKVVRRVNMGQYGGFHKWENSWMNHILKNHL